MKLTNLTPGISSAPKLLTMQKTWVTAIRRRNHEAQQRTNNSVEVFYLAILSKAKRQLSHSTQLIFERDYRHDRSESGLAMHAFMSSTFYFYLECDASYSYRVEYAFSNCPSETEVRTALSNYPFDSRSKEVQLKPDFNTFYSTVLQRQDSKYIASPPFK